MVSFQQRFLKKIILLTFFLLLISSCEDKSPPEKNKLPNITGSPFENETNVYHVYPGGSIQDALEAASKNPANKIIKVHKGVYRPSAKGEALIWFNSRHDGIRMEAVGEVILTAANPDISEPKHPSYPAVVNHVVYFGDGISQKTVFKGFKITGANNFVTGSGQTSPIESNNRIKKTLFFYTDGGAIKIFGQSYPTIENIEVFNNYASPCGGGVSVEHQGNRFKKNNFVLFKNCIFRNNRAQVTGSAIDLLPGSWAKIENCLFVNNISNTGVDFIGLLPWSTKYNPKHGSGALTVFPDSRVAVSDSTFTSNWAGIDDKGIGSTYVNTIFWKNNISGGISPGPRYELDIADGNGVKRCFIHGDTNDLRSTINPTINTFDPPDPNFDSTYIPRAPEYSKVGYRPIEHLK